MWTVVRPGDILYIGNTPVGVALEEVQISTSPTEQMASIASLVASGKVKLEMEALAVLDHLGFRVWKSELQKRKFEVQRKYSKSTNEDFEHKLRSIEEWLDES